MNQVYLDTARLLTQVAPFVFVDDTFALKGGSAINLFVRDMRHASAFSLSNVVVSSEIKGRLSMVLSPDFTVRQLNPNDFALMEAMMTVFGEAFHEVDTYTGVRPSAKYIERLLGDSHLIVLAALKDRVVVGGLIAYELQKFERERSEIYIYDLAVVEAHWRRGVATALIEELKTSTAARNAGIIFVQADLTDAPAIALYTKLGTRAEVLHFDIVIDLPTKNNH